MKAKSIINTVLLITIFSLINRVSGFLFRIYLSREIGAESLGLYQIAFSVFIVLITIICSGLPLTASRLTAKYNALNQIHKKNKIVTASLIIGGLASLALCIAILIFNNVFNFIFTDTRCFAILLTLLPAIIFSSVYSVIRGALWGQSNYFFVCVVELIEQFARIVICVFALEFLYFNIDGSIIASISLTLATFISSLLICIYYFKKFGKLAKPNSEYKELLKTSAPITGIRVISSFIQPIIAILIPIGLVGAGYTNSQAISLYGIAMGMAFPLLFLPTTIVDSLAIALIPDIASALANNKQDYIKNRIKNSIVFSFYIACLCVPIFLGLGLPICELLFDNLTAGYFLQSSAIIMIPLALNGISTTILNSLNLEKQSFLNYIFGSIALIISVLILPAYIGINAIIVGFGLSTLISSSLNIYTLKRHNKLTNDLTKIIIKIICCTIPSSLISYNLFNLLNLYLPLILNLILCIIVSLLLYMLLCEMFGIVKTKDLLYRFKFRKTTA